MKTIANRILCQNKEQINRFHKSLFRHWILKLLEIRQAPQLIWIYINNNHSKGQPLMLHHHCKMKILRRFIKALQVLVSQRWIELLKLSKQEMKFQMVINRDPSNFHSCIRCTIAGIRKDKNLEHWMQVNLRDLERMEIWAARVRLWTLQILTEIR